MNPDDLIVEARAKITWGETPSSVRYFLTSNGMSAADADVTIKELNAERNREIRRAGVRSTCIGAAVTCGAGILLYVMLRDSHTLFANRHAKAICGDALLGLYGIWKLVNGLVYLIRPQFEERSITEISE